MLERNSRVKKTLSITLAMMSGMATLAAGVMMSVNSMTLIAPKTGAAVIAAAANPACSLPIPNSTFIKSYRLLAITKINGAWPTKDGGYIVSGTTDPDIMFIPPDGFVSKLDAQGNTQWTKLLKTSNAAGGNRKGDEDVQSVIELNGGGYLMASKVWGFIKAPEWNSDSAELNKILLTRLDKNGKQLWSNSFPAYVEDARNSLLETNDGGFIFHANITDLAPNERGEDSAVYYDLPYSTLKVIKFDVGGNIKWSKDINNFNSRGNDSYFVPTPDGGYAVAGNIGEPNPTKTPPYDYDAYPGLAKFDKDFNFQWAKSLEGIPLELASAVPKANGGYTLGSTKIRQAAGMVRGLVKTADDGFIVMAQLTAMSLVTESVTLDSATPRSYLVAFKLGPAGSLEWTKRATITYNDFSGPMTDFSLVAAEGGKIVLAGGFSWANADYTAKMEASSAKQKWYTEKYGEMEMLKEDKQKTAESRADWKTVQATINAVTAARRDGVFVMETNQDMNIGWAKAMVPSRYATRHILKPTPDGGAVIAGEYETETVRKTMFSEKYYYVDGFVAKLDASGNAKDGKKWLSDFDKSILIETMTPYVVSNDLPIRTETYRLALTKRVPDFSLYSKTKTAAYAAYASSKTTLCPVAPDTTAVGIPSGGSGAGTGAAKTWPHINYERAVSVQTVNEKSATVNAELMPIVNKLFADQVKLTDNMGGAMLSYTFNREVTAADKSTVKNSLEALGYKIVADDEYQLTASKVGFFLILSFSINNTNKSFLTVTF